MEVSHGPSYSWRATITATAVKENAPTTITASATDCDSDEDHAILEADDPDNATNQALRNDLKVKAQLDCAAKADEGGYTNAKCDPFADDFDGIIQIFAVQGQKCEQAVENGLEGVENKKGADCPDLPAASAGETTSTTGDGTDSDSTFGSSSTSEPTTGALDIAAAVIAPMIDCDEDACVIDQELIDLVLTNSEGLLEGTTRLREKKIQGQVIGMSFTGISAGSLADQLGFQNGETIVAVNDLPFRTPEEFVAVAAAIFDAEEVIVTTQKGNHTEEHVFIRN